MVLSANTTYVILGHRPTDEDAILHAVLELTSAYWMHYDTEVCANNVGGSLVFVNTPMGNLNGWVGPMFIGEVAASE